MPEQVSIFAKSRSASEVLRVRAIELLTQEVAACEMGLQAPGTCDPEVARREMGLHALDGERCVCMLWVPDRNKASLFARCPIGFLSPACPRHRNCQRRLRMTDPAGRRQYCADRLTEDVAKT